MVIWGTAGKVVNLGQADVKHCETCEKERPFSVVLQYKLFHLYWIFGIVTSKQYLLLCDICHRGWVLDSNEVKEKLKKEPIPFMHQFGIWILIGIIAIGGALAFLTENGYVE